jgi:hypothetical protein
VIEILSLGAGVQSSCILLMSCKGELPKLDHAIFADTQWEPKAVYRQLEFLKNEAAKAGIPLHVVTEGNLREHVLEAARTGRAVSSPPFFTHGENGKPGIINRSCTSDFKIVPIERRVKAIIREALGLKPLSRLPTEPVVRQWVGISADETQRYKTSRVPWFTFYHPLIDTLRFTREDCLRWMKDAGFPEAPRSACIGCPFHSAHEWNQIKADPEQWADVVEFDRGIRNFACDKGSTPREMDPMERAKLDIVLKNLGLERTAEPIVLDEPKAVQHGLRNAVYLHRSLLPIDQAPVGVEPGQGTIDWGMQQECHGVCGV